MPPQKEMRIAILKKDLDNALRIDEIKLADRIKATGFKCRKCAQCCMSESGRTPAKENEPCDSGR